MESTNKRSFRGLFVGVNRYQAPEINHLRSAVRDAQALHAIFSDNLGDAAVLVRDEQATRGRLVDELRNLAAVSTADDVVVISFSGHGTDTHELVTYDADPYDLARSCLAMSELTQLVSAIPARQLVVVLDCCFSGGAGSKVLHSSRIPRGGAGGVPRSTEALLEQLAGDGRIILTAATADQPAWEDGRLGHGLLTYHLLQALTGTVTDEPPANIRLYDVLASVTRNVIASASGIAAARQQPTLRGQMDGEITWPVFVPGPRYSALFPEFMPLPVGQDLEGLRSHGISQPLLDAWSVAVPQLNELQQQAINDGKVLAGENVLVTAPTSSGKTMIGELAALKAAQTGGRSVFLLPTRALVNEQHDRFNRTYGPIGVRTIRATGEISDQVPALLRGQFELAILTYEMFSGLLLGNPHLLRLVSVVVIDEVQTIVDSGRGASLEFLLTLLKVRRSEGIAPQVVALSAVLGELGGLESWLAARLVSSTTRPVPLSEGVLAPDGVYRHITPDGDEVSEQLLPDGRWYRPGKEMLIPFVARLVADGQQVIVFRSMRGPARGCARYLAEALGLPDASKVVAALPTGDPSGASADLRHCLAGGVAFHISDLDRDERRAIEDEFRSPDSEIRVLVATTTLAQGVNLPVETVVIVELDHPAAYRATTPYSVAEYKNIAGRAGRLGLASQGRAIVLVEGGLDAQRKWDHYITGTPEDLRSLLADGANDRYSLVLRVVAVASRGQEDSGLSEDEVLEFLTNSFAAHQQRLAGAGEPFSRAEIAGILGELVSSELVASTQEGVRLTELGQLVARSQLSVQSAVRIASVFRLLQPQQLNRATLIGAAQLTVELDDIRLQVNGKGLQKEHGTFFGELLRHRPAAALVNAMGSGSDRKVSIGRAKRAVVCILWMAGVPIAQIEALVMKHLPSRDAAGPVRQTVSRTRDVIGTVIDIARFFHPDADLDRLAELLPVQIELGVPADLVPLAVQAGNQLGRQDYLRLNENGLTSAEAVLAAQDDLLRTCVGGSAARLVALREAATAAVSASAMPDFADLLEPAND